MAGEDGSIPYYFFNYNNPPTVGVSPHDHRDNLNGSFAFSVYHPGTDIPQVPWTI